MVRRKTVAGNVEPLLGDILKDISKEVLTKQNRVEAEAKRKAATEALRLFETEVRPALVARARAGARSLIFYCKNYNKPGEINKYLEDPLYEILTKEALSVTVSSKSMRPCSGDLDTGEGRDEAHTLVTFTISW